MGGSSLTPFPTKLKLGGIFLLLFCEKVGLGRVISS